MTHCRVCARAGMDLGSLSQMMGTVAAMFSSPLAAWWWPSVFYIFGMAGFIWAALFLWFEILHIRNTA